MNSKKTNSNQTADNTPHDVIATLTKMASGEHEMIKDGETKCSLNQKDLKRLYAVVSNASTEPLRDLMGDSIPR